MLWVIVLLRVTAKPKLNYFNKKFCFYLDVIFSFGANIVKNYFDPLFVCITYPPDYFRC